MWMLSLGTFDLETVRFEKFFHNYTSCPSELLVSFVFLINLECDCLHQNYLIQGTKFHLTGRFVWWLFCFIGTQETDSTLSSLVEMFHVHVYWHITPRPPMYIHKSTPQKLLSETRRKSVGLLDKLAGAGLNTVFRIKVFNNWVKGSQKSTN